MLEVLDLVALVEQLDLTSRAIGIIRTGVGRLHGVIETLVFVETSSRVVEHCVPTRREPCVVVAVAATPAFDGVLFRIEPIFILEEDLMRILRTTESVKHHDQGEGAVASRGKGDIRVQLDDAVARGNESRTHPEGLALELVLLAFQGGLGNHRRSRRQSRDQQGRAEQCRGAFHGSSIAHHDRLSAVGLLWRGTAEIA